MASSGITFGGFLGAQQGIVLGVGSGQTGWNLFGTIMGSGVGGMIGGGFGKAIAGFMTEAAGVLPSVATKRAIQSVSMGFANAFANMAGQELTTGRVNVVQALVSGAIGAAVGGMGVTAGLGDAVGQSAVNTGADTVVNVFCTHVWEKCSE